MMTKVANEYFRLKVQRILVVIAALFVLPLCQSAYGQNGVLVGKGVELRSVIEEVAIRTGRVFIVDPRVNGTVTINAGPDVSLTPEETWEVFLATLQVRGYAAVPIGKNEYKIVPNEISRRDAGSGFTGNSNGAAITRIVRLNFVDSRTTANNLKNLISESGVVSPVVESNSLIIVDSAANVRRIMEVIRRIDTDRSIVKTVLLRNAPASEVAAVLRDMGQASGENPRAGSMSIVAVDASNTLILRGTQSSINKLLPIIENLDKTGLSQVDLSVVYLKHANAESMVTLLKEVIENRNGGGGEATAGSGKSPTIVADAQTNALIINANPETQRTIQSIVQQLDIRRAQVLIEAIIVSISDDAARDLGLQYIISGNGSDGTPFISNSSATGSPNIFAAAASAFLLTDSEEGTTTVVNTDGTTTTTSNGTRSEIPGTSGLIEAAVSSLLGANGLTLGGASQRPDGSIYGAILTAVQSDTNSRVLSTPSIMTLDNQKARLQVGQEIPVTSGEALGNDLNNSFRTVEREEIGVILEVTPQISDGDTIQLDIIQEVSSIQSAVQTTNTDFITNKSTITNSVLAEDGQILVLGGLIDNSEERTETKIPFLGDIPLAGNLFKQSAKDGSKSTLLVFIRPTIIRDAATANAATARKYNYVSNELRKFRRTDQAEIDTIADEYLGKDNEFDPNSVLGRRLQDVMK